MSPLGINILLHYYSRTDDFPFRHDAPAQRDMFDAFLSAGILTKERRRGFDRLYDITERGETYVQALCNVPFPVNRWVMPEGFEALQKGPQC